MIDRPIIFSGPMVRALLDGRKTQTRRVITNAAADDMLAVFGPKFIELPGNRDVLPIRAILGDRLWAREACHIDGKEVNYRVDLPGDPTGFGWRPSIHMPRWASRLTLTVTDVRVQRVQDISEADAWAEGCKVGAPWDNLKGFFPADEPDPSGKGMRGWDCARDWFGDLWDGLNGPRGFGWEANPWVAAYTFNVHHQNIDQMEVS